MIPYLLAFMGGMAAYLALLHLMTALGGENKARHLSMALLASALAGYILLSSALYGTADPTRYAELARWQGAVAVLVGALAYWFLAFYTSVRPRPFLLAVTAALIAIVWLDLASPAGIFFGKVTGIHAVALPWGETVPVPVATPNPRELWFNLAFWPLPFFAAYAIVTQYRRGERRDAVLVAAALLSALVPMFVDTFVLGVDVFPFPVTEISLVPASDPRWRL